MEQEGNGEHGVGNLDYPSTPKPAGHPLPPSAFTAGRILAASEPCPGAVRTCTLPSRAGSQRISVEAWPTPLAVVAHCVVQAAQASAGHGVTVAHGIEIHVPVALAGLTGMHGTSLPQGVPEKPVITELTAFSWGRWKGGEDPAVPTLPTAPVPTHPQPHSPLCPGGQWVQTTSPLLGTSVQGERPGQGQGLQSSERPAKGLP